MVSFKYMTYKNQDNKYVKKKVKYLILILGRTSVSY